MINIENVNEMIKKVVNKEITISSVKKRVLNDYTRTKAEYSNSPYIVIDDIVWSDDRAELFNFLHTLNIERVIIADTSTALMETLTHFIDNGAVIETTIKVKRDNSFGRYESGLVVKIK